MLRPAAVFLPSPLSPLTNWALRRECGRAFGQHTSSYKPESGREARLLLYLSSDDSPQLEKQEQVPVLGTTWALCGD